MAEADDPRPQCSNEHTDLRPLSRADALAARIQNETIQQSDMVRILLEFASECDAIVPKPVTREINSDGFVANVPPVEYACPLHCELAAARSRYREVARRLLDELPTETLVRVVTELAAKTTDGGRKRASTLIEDIVNDYEIAAQSFIDGESFNVRKLLALIRLRVARGHSSRIDGLVEQLRGMGANWTLVTKPIQMICCAKGLDHLASRALAREVISLAAGVSNANDPSSAMVATIETIARGFTFLPEAAADAATGHAAVTSTRKGREEFRLDNGDFARSLAYSADIGVIFRKRLEISATGLAWKGRVYKLEDINRMRWGVERSAIRLSVRAPYVIRVQTPSGCAIIKLRSADTFHAVVDGLWRGVGVRLLFEYVEHLRIGGRIAFPGVFIEDDAVTLAPKTLFGVKEETRLSWDKIAISKTDHYLVLQSKSDSRRRALLSYAEMDNIPVIEHMVGLLLASGRPSISALLR